MGSFRQESLARRAAISAVVLYALLLQGFLAASAPTASFAFPGGISSYNCSLDGSGSGTPGGDRGQHHGLCCILACAAAGCAYAGTAFAFAFAAFPERAASPIVYALAQRLPARPPLKHYFSARGPPATV
jgi:hypothetical protein